MDKDELLTDDETVEAGEPEPTEEELPEETALDEGDDEGEDGELIVEIDEPGVEPERKPVNLVNELRKANRELVRQLRETKRQPQQAAPALPELGPEPTFVSSGSNIAKWQADMRAWTERKVQHELAAAQHRTVQDAQQREFDAKRQQAFERGRKLAGERFEDVVADIDTLMPSAAQQGMIIHGADDPARLLYALASHPAKARELAAITDPVKFAFAVAKLETKLKDSPRKAPPPPERTVSGTARKPGTEQMDRLRAQAEKTGDYTAYMAAKRRLKTG